MIPDTAIPPASFPDSEQDSPSPSWLAANTIAESHATLSPDWETEIAHRLKEIEDGTVEPVPFDESLRRAYARIADLHTAGNRANA